MAEVVERLRSESEDFQYDPFSKEVMANPHPFYRILREKHPVYYIEKYNMFVLSRFEDVFKAYSIKENKLLLSEHSLPPPDYLLSHRNEAGPPPPAPLDPLPLGGLLPSPHYEDLRTSNIQPLKPSGVNGLKELVERMVNDRLDALIAKGSFDLTQEFAGHISADVMCRLMGIPDELVTEALELVNALTVTDPEVGGTDNDNVNDKTAQFLLPWVIRRMEAGADGSVQIVDGMINYRVRGVGRPLRPEEVALQLMPTFVGGIETVPKVAAHGLMELYRHPGQLAEIRSDLDSNVPSAVEEILRFCAPAQWFMRTVHEEVEIGGQTIKPGQRILPLIGSALRDEREFDEPDAFRWNRKIRRVLSFGTGQHHCTGANLARLELRTIVREILKRDLNIRFDMDAARRYPSSFQWGWNRLPVTVQ